MDLTVSLPKLDYGQHGSLREDYKYSDDLINPTNWSYDISDFSGRINEYIDQRDRFADIRSKELRQVGLPPGESRQTIDVFQTLSGDILNHSIFLDIGKTIKNQYDHFSVVPGRDIPTVPQTSIVDVDNLPKEISNSLVDLSSIGSSLSNGLSILTSPGEIKFNEKYINDNDPTASYHAVENPNLSKYNLHPEVIGTDIARLTSGSTDSNSVAFTSGGLFGWKYITPQQRTIGSAGDFGSIIIDILFKIAKTSSSQNEIKLNKNDENTNYIFKEIKKYYDPLVTSNIFKDLSDINEDVGPNPNTSPSTDRNPLVLGIKGDELRQPDIYGLWCVWRSIRIPFYNRENVSGQTPFKISDLFGYEIASVGNQIEFKPRSLNYDEAEIKNIKTQIIKGLKGDQNSKSALAVNISELVTEYNVPVTEQTSLAEASIADIVGKLEKLGGQAWFNIISQAFTSLYLSLFIAADTDWSKQTINAGIEGLNIPLDRLKYDIGGNPVQFNGIGRHNLIKAANFEYNKYRNTLKTYLGINKNNTMGGTSLMGSDPFSIQRYGTVISYPGDSGILENMSGYLTMMLSDINIIEQRLQQSLDNMSNMYWYRDILRWLEVLFTTFKPNDAPVGRSYTGAEIKARFFKLEKILKILYSKQIIIMNEYIQKTKILQKRYIGTGKSIGSRRCDIRLNCSPCGCTGTSRRPCKSL